MEAFISNFIWPCDGANQGHLPVSALTLAMQLSQQDSDMHLAVGCRDFSFIYLSIHDSQDKYPALDIRQPAVGFARQTPAKGICILPAVQESKATQCVQGNAEPLSSLLYPLDSPCAVPLSWQEGAQPEAREVWRTSSLLGGLVGNGTSLSLNTATSCFKERCLIKQKSRKEKSWRRQFLAYPHRQPYPGFWRIYLRQTCTQVMRFCVGLPMSSCVAFWCIGNLVKHTGANKRIELGQPGD